MDAVGPLSADLLFLQEVGRPKNSSASVAWAGILANQGTLVATPSGRLALSDVGASARRPSPVRVVGAAELTALNVWAKPKPSYVGHVNAMLDAFRRRLAGRSVMAGDFNTEGPQSAGDKPHHIRLVARLRDEFNLVSAYHQHLGIDHGREVHPTYFHLRRPNEPWHIDFCFIPVEWSSKVRSVEVLDGEPWRKLSDHRPVVVDIDV